MEKASMTYKFGNEGPMIYIGDNNQRKISGNSARRMERTITVWFQFSAVKFCPELERSLALLHHRKFDLSFPVGSQYETLLQPLQGSMKRCFIPSLCLDILNMLDIAM